jgi:hypothetical protein
MFLKAHSFLHMEERLSLSFPASQVPRDRKKKMLHRARAKVEMAQSRMRPCKVGGRNLCHLLLIRTAIYHRSAHREMPRHNFPLQDLRPNKDLHQ